MQLSKENSARHLDGLASWQIQFERSCQETECKSVTPPRSSQPEPRFHTDSRRWWPAHKGVEGNEKPNEWAKLPAEELDTRGVEWLSYSDRMEVRPMPLPRSLANIRREISEKEWTEARRWAGGRVSKQKYRLAETHKPDSTVAGSTKRLASRFYQLKAGHCRTGKYLHWAKNRPDPQCWWFQCPSQIKEHLFKVCPKWKGEQKILWAEVRKETGRWKSR